MRRSLRRRGSPQAGLAPQKPEVAQCHLCLDERVGEFFDVYTFYAEHPIGPYPARWPIRNVDFGPSQFGRNPEGGDAYEGRRVDLLGRSLKASPNGDPIEALRAYLERPRTKTARCLAKKAVVLIDPEPLRGQIVWGSRERG